MGRIKELYIQLKREYPDWDEEDLPYLFEQHVKHMEKPKIKYKRYLFKKKNNYNLHNNNQLK